MSKRYDTLDVSLNASKSSPKKLNKTIEANSEKEQDQSSKPDNDQKVNKFKELYLKNQKLRKQLKILNQKLNERLDKLKLPSVKKKAMSVDLNHPMNPPSKALVRELQNGYKQIAMYKKQVEVLKGKEETPENYDKLRNTENMITYMDMEIDRVQEDLKSIKNVKKLQQKVLNEDVQNAELKQRLNDYLKQIKSFKDKFKEIERKSRKRQEQFKKQQAYLVELKQTIRKFRAEEEQIDKPQPEKAKEIDKEQLNTLKYELRFSKNQYQESCKKVELLRVHVKNIKTQKNNFEQQYRDKQTLYKQLLIQVQTFTRLLKDLQLKKYQQTGVREQELTKQMKMAHSNMLKLEEIQDEDSLAYQTRGQLSKLSEPKQALANSSPPSVFPTSDPKDEREWKGKVRQVSMGYSTPTDTLFKQSGTILGLKAYFDQNKYIVGISPILLIDQARVQSKLYGNVSSIEVKWEVEQGDYISQIVGSFSEEGYLAQIVVKTWRGNTGVFGNPQKEKFQFNLQYGEYFSGIFGGLRRLGQDSRITQIGFWIYKL